MLKNVVAKNRGYFLYDLIYHSSGIESENHCRKFYEKHNRKIIILHDQTYVITVPSETPDKIFFYATSLKDVEYSMKTQHISKVPKKYMVWQALQTRISTQRYNLISD